MLGRLGRVEGRVEGLLLGLLAGLVCFGLDCAFRFGLDLFDRAGFLLLCLDRDLAPRGWLREPPR